jgi:hypothetical protein
MNSNHHQNLTQYTPAGDGWDDAAAEGETRMVRGSLLKFSDWRWTVGKEATAIDSGKRLLAVATSAAWIRWQDGKPVEYRIRRPGERLPEREELGFDDETEWDTGPSGEPKDPWANTRLLFLTDPATAEAYTFSTSSYGGRAAVIDLADAIQRMRLAHPNATPIVELHAVEMPTRYGRKSKPLFKIVGWQSANVEGEPVKPAIVERILPLEEVKRAERQIRDREIDDDIPF